MAVVAWWTLDQIGSIFNAGPTLGARTLVVLRHHGGPVRIPPIGTFSLEPQSSQAFAAQQAVQSAIDGYRARRGTSTPPDDASEVPDASDRKAAANLRRQQLPAGEHVLSCVPPEVTPDVVRKPGLRP